MAIQINVYTMYVWKSKNKYIVTHKYPLSNIESPNISQHPQALIMPSHKWNSITGCGI